MFYGGFAVAWGVSSLNLVVASAVFHPEGTNQLTLGCEP